MYLAVDANLCVYYLCAGIVLLTRPPPRKAFLMLMGAPLPWRWHSFAVAPCNLTHLVTANNNSHYRLFAYMCTGGQGYVITLYMYMYMYTDDMFLILVYMVLVYIYMYIYTVTCT